jgi:hypothetical protein
MVAADAKNTEGAALAGGPDPFSASGDARMNEP